MIINDKISKSIRSPRFIASHGKYIQRQHKKNISIYRNTSPCISKLEKKSFKPSLKSENKYFTSVTKSKKELEDLNKIKNGSFSKFLIKNQNLERNISKKIYLNQTKRSISQQITKKPSYNSRINNFEPRNFLRKKEKERAKSPLSISQVDQRPDFTSLSPKIKRRFGSVTVGKVIRKREITKDKIKQINPIFQQIKCNRSPIRR